MAHPLITGVSFSITSACLAAFLSRNRSRIFPRNALTFFFDVSVEELFPALANDIKEEVVRHAYDLYVTQQGKPSRTTKAKLDYLERMLGRTTKAANKKEV